MKFEYMVENIRELCHTILRDDRWFFKGGCTVKNEKTLEKLLGLREYELAGDQDRFISEWVRYDLNNGATLLITLKEGSWYFILDNTEKVEDYLSL